MRFVFIAAAFAAAAGCGGERVEPAIDSGNHAATADNAAVLQTPASETPAAAATTSADSNATLEPANVAGRKLVPVDGFAGQVRLLIPETFTALDDAAVAERYPSANRPESVFADESGRVNVAFTHSAQALRIDQLPSLHQQMDQLMHNIHQTAEWHASSVSDINARQWMVLEFTVETPEGRIRNMMYGTPVNGRLALIAINIPAEVENDWLEVARAVAGSFTVSGE